jgi:hypothetical protein
LVAPDALQQRPRALDRIDDAHDQRAVRVARSGAGCHCGTRGFKRGFVARERLERGPAPCRRRVDAQRGRARVDGRHRRDVARLGP